MRTVIIMGMISIFLLIGANYSLAKELDHREFRDTEQCFQCHGEDVNKEEYEKSKHGNLDCIYCHDFSDTGGKGSQGEATEKCGSCHIDAVEGFNNSVHQQHDYGPDCGDCHGNIHYIFPTNEPGSPMNRKNLAESCGTCHAQVAESYNEDFHGKAVVLGAKNSPDCTYCHGSHLILSSQDSESPTNPENKSKLCAKCHEGNILGVDGLEHYTLKPTGYSAPMYWIKKAFMWLILLVVGFFLIHILLDLAYKLRSRNSRP